MFYEYTHLGSPDYLKIERGENFSFPPHLHQCFEIIIITSGNMNITVDGKENALKAGEALMIFPNQIHELNSNESTHLLCIFSPKIVQAYTTKTVDKTPDKCTFCPDKYLINALKELDNVSSSVEKKGVLYSLCAQFDKGATYLQKNSDKENLLHKFSLTWRIISVKNALFPIYQIKPVTIIHISPDILKRQ